MESQDIGAGSQTTILLTASGMSIFVNRVDLIVDLSLDYLLARLTFVSFLYNSLIPRCSCLLS